MRIEEKYNNLYHSLALNIVGKFRPFPFSQNRNATFRAIIANSGNYTASPEEENAISSGKTASFKRKLLLQVAVLLLQETVLLL